MKILGVDYGRAKIGLAIADGPLAEPHSVLKVNSFEDALKKVEQVVQVMKVEKVIVGVSEGEMGKEQEKFASLLGKRLNMEVVTWDEALSTFDAQQISREAGLGPKKRREMEDAFAAAIMVQSYLDHGTTTEGSSSI